MSRILEAQQPHFMKSGIGGRRLRLPNPREFSASQIYALVFGAIHVVIGFSGLLLSPGLADHELWSLFPVNAPHSGVHLLMGLVGFAAFATGRHLHYARSMAITFGTLTMAGFLPQPLFGLVSVGGPDMFLHGFVGLVGDSTSREYTRW